MNDKKIKSFVNEIFKHEGIPAVKNFASEFSDGGMSITRSNVFSPVCKTVQHSL